MVSSRAEGRHRVVFECSSAAALIWQQNVDGTRKRKFVGSIKVQSENLPPNK